MCFFTVFIFSAIVGYAQNEGGQVELNGDVVEYSVDGSVVTATGNVVIIHPDATLIADKVVFYRNDKRAEAEGNVVLNTNDGEISGERLVFNFDTMTGVFNGARLIAKPYHGFGERVSKVGENHIVVDQGFATTCDYDKPHYKLASKSINIFPKDYMEAKHVTMKVGKVPLFYIPRFKQNLKDDRARFRVTPGHDGDWGNFLLAEWRYDINRNVKTTIHADYRSQLGFASGVDLEYKTEDYGEGYFSGYYTGERDQEMEPEIRTRERYRAEYRHKWEIDEKTNTIFQYYKLSDSDFLRRYFENEHDEDANPNSFFVLTRALDKGTLSLRSDFRVNRFNTEVERLPQVRYDLTNTEIAETGLYFKNLTVYDNLRKKDPEPTTNKLHTHRIHTDSEVSYPFKLDIFEIKPFVGGNFTYYSRTFDRNKYDSIRGQLETGTSLSTKFYRVFDVNTEFLGMPINRLRHIITPSVNYIYANDPTVSSSSLDQYDGIDSLTNHHNINFSLENKLQTKRDGNAVDLLRFILSTDYRLKQDPATGGFDKVRADIDFKPVSWLSFYFDSSYDTRKDRLDTANFDIYVNSGDKWSFGLGKRYNREVDDQITTEVKYRLNQKWAFKIFDRFDLDDGTLEEQEYTLSRDLHAWEMDFRYNDTRGEGQEYIVLFRLKAFPEIGFDAGAQHNQPKPGSQ